LAVALTVDQIVLEAVVRIAKTELNCRIGVSVILTRCTVRTTEKNTIADIKITFVICKETIGWAIIQVALRCKTCI
jgi:hypothetical protein